MPASPCCANISGAAAAIAVAAAPVFRIFRLIRSIGVLLCRCRWPVSGANSSPIACPRGVRPLYDASPGSDPCSMAGLLRRKSWRCPPGWGQDEDCQRSQDAGFDTHLVKPVDDAVLMRLLASLPS